MSYNQNFYNDNFHGNTFQNTAQFLHPPPPPPAFFFPAQAPNTDADFLKQFDYKLQKKIKLNAKRISISMVRDEMCSLIVKLKELKSKESILTNNINEMLDEDWSSNMRQVEETKTTISKLLSNIKNLNMEVLQKMITKRSAKRARLKRLRFERKKEKEEWIKQMKERSRKIDEKWQKTQDDIIKVKQEEEAKTQADIVLKETLRKKHDAKKYVVKLNALIRLRRARLNTATGRGENVCEVEADTFNSNIEKLKTLWKQRLAIYEKEEIDLRLKLKEDTGERELSSKESENRVLDNLAKWKEALFGGGVPQADFAGDVAGFIAVRSQWDEFLSNNNSDGSTLPIGWLPPSKQKSL